MPVTRYSRWFHPEAAVWSFFILTVNLPVRGVPFLLKRLRKQKRITQFQLAEALNISQTSVSKYERGVCQPDLNVVVLMSDYFGISVDELVRGLCAQEAAFRKNKNSPQ